MRRGAPEIQVRMAEPGDASLVASVLESAFTEYRSSYTHEAFLATALYKDKIETRMNEGPMWVALCNEVIVGTVAAVTRGEAFHVRGMGIVPAARGKKIGELLLKHVESFAAARGYKRMTLSTTHFLTRAIKLYEHFGFQPSDEGPFDLYGTPLFTMVKDVRPTDQELKPDW
jgi:putative acetyltransferase